MAKCISTLVLKAYALGLAAMRHPMARLSLAEVLSQLTLASIDDDELARMRLGSDGGPLCD